MKAFLNWIVQNLSHIFSVIGILLSLYFGVWYVPDWLAENQREKIINAQKNLEQSIKELVFADTICSYNEINILIKAKELEISESYPLEPNEVLIKVQESFMQDRFLPLLKRKQLMAEIENIKKQIPSTNIKPKKKESNKAFILGFVSIVLTVLSVVIGIVSYYLRYIKEKEKDEEIANQINQSENLLNHVDSALSYENKMISVIKNFPGVKLIENQKIDYGFDVTFEYKNKTFYVECKYLIRSKVGLSSFERFVNQSEGLEGDFLFVYNTDLTNMVKNRIAELRKVLFLNTRRKIFLIKASTENEFEVELNKLLKVL
ncbi:hypothetical protein SD960_00755 [Flavobacterium sp. MMLR14_040]|uniref:hypothetical protein n=1 Tax=Flavobacterium sp. MMLR14_040 TaxID=3093843 RepID=UPI0029906A00|nr:hypothetical protein [Flavobacterium sp. MMLR14_040]MDW8848602.1 hypothetical protein [Flavobacterium sp. MMLR14_040]